MDDHVYYAPKTSKINSNLPHPQDKVHPTRHKGKEGRQTTYTSIRESLQPTNPTLPNYFQTPRNKTKDTTPSGYNNDNQSRQFLGNPNDNDSMSGLGKTTGSEIDEQELGSTYSYKQRFRRSHLKNPVLLGQPLEHVQNHDESNVYDNHNELMTSPALANLIANLTLDTEENKTILKQLKKANASLTQELEKCKTNLDETNSALGEAIS
ncbi:hypothetical protein Tco_0961403 [Tanacetum coccineum]